MENKKILSLLITILFIFVAGCQESNDTIKIDYQTFYSNDASILQSLDENLTMEEINEIAQLGEALAFQLEYPIKWESEYNIFGTGLFSVIFFTEKAEYNYSKSITVDLLYVQPNTTIHEMKLQFHNTYTSESTEKEFDLNEDMYVWKITGKREDILDEEYNNFNQGTALIRYNKREVYKIETFFKDSESSNMKIFDNMINSFGKIKDR